MTFPILLTIKVVLCSLRQISKREVVFGPILVFLVLTLAGITNVKLPRVIPFLKQEELLLLMLRRPVVARGILFVVLLMRVSWKIRKVLIFVIRKIFT